MSRVDTWNSGEVVTTGDYTSTQTVTVPRTFPAGSTLTVRYRFIHTSESYVHTLGYSLNNSSWTTVKTSGFAYNATSEANAPAYTFTLANPCKYVRTISQTDGTAGIYTWSYILSATYYTITANVSGSGGTISGGGEYAKGSTCVLKATPSSGYKFLYWKKGSTTVSSSSSYSFSVSSDSTITAYFEKLSYTISATASPSNGGSVSGGGTYSHGSTAVLTASPNSGFKFVEWKKGSTRVSTNTSYSFVVTGAESYTAYFERADNCKIKINDTWRDGVIFIKTGGVWVKGEVWIKTNNIWKKGV